MKYKKSMWIKDIQKNIDEVRNIFDLNNIKYEICGGVRRKKEWVQNIIIVVDRPLHDIYSILIYKLDDVKLLNVAVPQKRTSMLIKGILFTFYFAEKDCWGTMLLYCTGSIGFNKVLSSKAIELGMRLTARGLFCGGAVVAGNTEEQVFNVLGFEYIPPEKRQTKREFFGERILLKEIKKFGF